MPTFASSISENMVLPISVAGIVVNATSKADAISKLASVISNAGISPEKASAIAKSALQGSPKAKQAALQAISKLISEVK